MVLHLHPANPAPPAAPPWTRAGRGLRGTVQPDYPLRLGLSHGAAAAPPGTLGAAAATTHRIDRLRHPQAAGPRVLPRLVTLLLIPRRASYRRGDAGREALVLLAGHGESGDPAVEHPRSGEREVGLMPG
ncbi:hypothetical protein Q5425_06895 [Amycolatopsis sp. A133]|uniref:hypothetical protein n=1 Tax=Amycolatopsis sp. A133 TaxID=3064472 RepID=UPI0027F64477|nr:hypothetical protein [Amycolatopsis sp. A133]MDQ7803451.1 hypothetical protein [Amycolatopsis sp. A133]